MVDLGRAVAVEGSRCQVLKRKCKLGRLKHRIAILTTTSQRMSTQSASDHPILSRKDTRRIEMTDGTVRDVEDSRNEEGSMGNLEDTMGRPRDTNDHPCDTKDHQMCIRSHPEACQKNTKTPLEVTKTDIRDQREDTKDLQTDCQGHQEELEASTRHHCRLTASSRHLAQAVFKPRHHHLKNTKGSHHHHPHYLPVVTTVLLSLAIHQPQCLHQWRWELR